MTSTLLPAGSVARAATVLAAAALAVAGVVHGGALASAARMSDTRSTGAASVSSGTLSLSLSGGATSGSWTGSVSLVPGQAAYAGLTVTDGGTLPLRYAASSLSTSALAAELRLDVVVLPAGTSICSSTTYATGTLVSTAGGPFGRSPAIDVIGSTTPGVTTGDRLLAPAASERLCLRVAFPVGSGLGYAGRGTSASTTFTFVAESS